MLRSPARGRRTGRAGVHASLVRPLRTRRRARRYGGISSRESSRLADLRVESRDVPSKRKEFKKSLKRDIPIAYIRDMCVPDHGIGRSPRAPRTGPDTAEKPSTLDTASRLAAVVAYADRGRHNE